MTQDSKMDKDANGGASGRDSPAAADLINDNLRRIFQQEIERELPERFTNLIEKLRARESSPRSNAGARDTTGRGTQ